MEDQIISYKSGVPTYVDQIVNSNLPNPMQVNQLIDSTGSTGSTGDYLQKNASNEIIWGPVEFTTEFGQFNRDYPYSFPAASTQVPFNADVASSANIQINGNGGVDIPFDGYYKVSVSGMVEMGDSATQYRFALTLDSTEQSVYWTPLTQAGSLNQVVPVILEATFFANATLEVALFASRIAGINTAQLPNAGAQSLFRFSIQQIPAV